MAIAGTDVAMENADVVIMSDNVQNIVFALASAGTPGGSFTRTSPFALGVLIILIISALGFSLLRAPGGSK